MRKDNDSGKCSRKKIVKKEDDGSEYAENSDMDFENDNDDEHKP